MDEQDLGTTESKRAAYMATPEIERVFGVPDALDNIDAVTAMGIIEYIESPRRARRRLPRRLAQAERTALAAIVALADHNPDMARQLIAELNA